MAFADTAIGNASAANATRRRELSTASGGASCEPGRVDISVDVVLGLGMISPFASRWNDGATSLVMLW